MPRFRPTERPFSSWSVAGTCVRPPIHTSFTSSTCLAQTDPSAAVAPHGCVFTAVVSRWQVDSVPRVWRPSRAGSAADLYGTARWQGARRLTLMPRDVREIAWSPDSKSIAFVAADAPDPALPQSQGGRFDAERGWRYGACGSDAVAAVDCPHVRRGNRSSFTTGPSSVSAANAYDIPAPQLSWAPDGNNIGIIRKPTANANDAYKAAVELIDVKTHSSKVITPRLLLGGALAFSPDGHIAFLSPRDDTRVNEFEVHVVTPSGAAAASWMQSVDREIAGLRWMPDGSMLAGGLDHAHVAFWLQAPNGQAVQLKLGDANPNCERQRCDVSVSTSGGIAFAGEEPGRPTDVYVMSTTGSVPRRLTHYGDEIAALDSGGNDMVEWDGPDADSMKMVYLPIRRASPATSNTHSWCCCTGLSQPSRAGWTGHGLCRSSSPPMVMWYSLLTFAAATIAGMPIRAPCSMISPSGQAATSWLA